MHRRSVRVRAAWGHHRGIRADVQADKLGGGGAGDGLFEFVQSAVESCACEVGAARWGGDDDDDDGEEGVVVAEEEEE